MLDVLVTDKLLDILMISITCSVVLMVLIQKFKSFSFIKKDYVIWMSNLVFSFGLGIPFAIYFYSLDIYSALWVSVFSFIGAPSIYEILKLQNIINYTPKALDDDVVVIPKENEIVRNL